MLPVIAVLVVQRKHTKHLYIGMIFIYSKYNIKQTYISLVPVLRYFKNNNNYDNHYLEIIITYITCRCIGMYRKRTVALK